MNDILKKRWGFDGFVESDYTAVAELRACPPKTPDEGPCGHGVAADGPDAARVAFNAGVDSEMVSTYARDYGEKLVADGKLPMARIDDAVRRILRVKLRAGLFEKPYADLAQIPARTMTPQDVAAARETAGRSMVLLKNAATPSRCRRTSRRSPSSAHSARRRPTRSVPGRARARRTTS